MGRQKRVFASILVGLSVLLILLPFTVTVNDVLTKVLEKNSFYGWIQTNIVPVEARMMGAILIPFGYKYSFSPTNSIVAVNGVNMQITWNCLGWQSMLLLLVTFFVGFGRKYKAVSISVATGVGILGTFWVNIFRMLFTVLLAVHAPEVFRIVFHDYLAAGVTVVWLIFFWWFSYKYILEDKKV